MSLMNTLSAAGFSSLKSLNHTYLELTMNRKGLISESCKGFQHFLTDKTLQPLLVLLSSWSFSVGGDVCYIPWCLNNHHACMEVCRHVVVCRQGLL